MQFPVIGSYTDAVAEHVPGTDIDVSGIAAGERVITIDNLKYASVFVDNFEEAMSHYEVRGQYSTEMGRKLAQTIDGDVVTTLRTCVGGVCWVPIACRRKDKTIMIRAKDVVMIRIEGASVRIVSRNKICKALDTFPGSSTSSIPN